MHHPPHLRVDAVQHIGQRKGIGVVGVAGVGRVGAAAFLQQFVGILGGSDHQRRPGTVDHGPGQSAKGVQHPVGADFGIGRRPLVHPVDVLHQFVYDDDYRPVAD